MEDRKKWKKKYRMSENMSASNVICTLLIKNGDFPLSWAVFVRNPGGQACVSNWYQLLQLPTDLDDINSAVNPAYLVHKPKGQS